MRCHFFISAASWLICASLVPSAQGQLIVAHRGASADAPENTLSAFRLAWEQGADAIEGDFHLTADGQVACIHDKTTERTAGDSLQVSESSLDELRKLDAGSWKDARFAGQRIPTLAEVLDTVPTGKIMLIEIKSGPEILPAVKRILEQTDVPWANLRIISFERDVVERAKQMLPKIESYWLVDFKWDKKLKHWYPSLEHVIGVGSQIGADGLDVRANQPVLTDKFTRLCDQAGFSKHAYTVDEPAVALQLQELGFDSITTNRPGFLRQALRLPIKELAPPPETTRAESTPKKSEGVGSN
ncbi:glycerophosphodiester phosphodiesterase [Pirellulales bacterium]|nr:glycerophosphodiester phosphodiesterase [Pirellulales bacterium]